MVSDETKRKISLAAKGRKHSDSAKMKMSISRLGKPRPDIRLRMIGNKNLVGHHHSEETRRRISEANLGRPVSDLCRLKSSQRAIERNRVNPPRKGKTCSAEHRRKLSEARKRYLERKKTDASQN